MTIELYTRLMYAVVRYFGAFIVLKFVLRGVNEVRPKNCWLIEISMMKNNNKLLGKFFSRALLASVRVCVCVYVWLQRSREK